MQNYILIFLITFYFSSINAQEKFDQKLPEPELGWTQLIGKIGYPELAIVAGIDAEYKAEVTIDSKGKIKNSNVINTTKYNGHDWMFLPSINDAIKNVKWRPGNIARIDVEMKITFNINFSQSNKTLSSGYGIIGTTVKSSVSTTILIDSIAVCK